MKHKDIHPCLHRQLLVWGLLLWTMAFTMESQAQRLEIRFNKEFSTDSILNKSMGAGASFILDVWHPNLDVQINFDYAGHKGDVNYLGYSTRFTKLKAGISALYTHPLGERLYLRVGGDLSYNNLHKTITFHRDTISATGLSSTSFRGQMLGIGAIAQIQVRLGRLFRIGAGVIPTYLIPLSAKVDRPNVERTYTKGIFVCQLQIGLEIKLGNLLSNSEDNQNPSSNNP